MQPGRPDVSSSPASVRLRFWTIAHDWILTRLARIDTVVPVGPPTNLVLPLSDSDSEVSPSDDLDLSKLTA